MTTDLKGLLPDAPATVLQREHEDLQIDLQQAYEQLGSVKQTIVELEADRRSAQLRRERSQVRGELKVAIESWLALDVAGRAVDVVRSRFERTCQPPTLVAAGDFLKQLTAGRYANVWTPLGKRHLCVDDDRDKRGARRTSYGTLEASDLSATGRLIAASPDLNEHLRQFSQPGVELTVSSATGAVLTRRVG